MIFHATAAVAPARPNFLFTFRNHLLCSVCTAILLAGTGGMARAEIDIPAPPAQSSVAPEAAPPASPVTDAAATSPQAPENPEPAPIVSPVAGAATSSAKKGGSRTVGKEEELSVAVDEKFDEVVVNGEKAWTVNENGIGGFAYVAGEIGKGTVNTGGKLIVEDGGKADNVTVSTGGDLAVGPGGTATEVVVNGDKAWTVNENGIGGFALVAGGIGKGTVNTGGKLIVDDGGKADNVTVNTGGDLAVRAGGTATEVVVNGDKAWMADEDGIGGFAIVAGEIGKGTVNTGGKLIVDPDGKAGYVTVNAGGRLFVDAGGTATEVVVNGEKAWTLDEDGIGGFAIVAGEIGKGTVNTGGKLIVDPDGKAGYVTVNTGGRLFVDAGGTASEVVVNGDKAWDLVTGLGGIGGVAYISGEGSRLDHGTVNQGGYLQVVNKATAGRITVLNGGWLDVLAEGSADNVHVNGGYASTAGQIGTATVTGKDSLLDVQAGGTAGTLNVRNGGKLDVYAGGEITGKSTVENGGVLSVWAEGKAGDIEVNGGDSSSPTSYAAVNGTAGDITIGGNAALNGSGTLRNVRAHMGGNVFPGNTVDKFATLTTTGNVTFDKGSFFSVQIANDGLRFSKLAAQGQATLDGGSVKVRAEDFAGTDSQGNAIPQFLSEQQVKNLFQKSFVILTAEKGLTGRFEKIEPNYNYITPLLAYTDKTVSVGFDLTETARTEKEQKLADELKQKQAEADRLKAEQTQLEAERLKLQLWEEQIKSLVLVDAVTSNQKSTGHAVMQLGLGNRLLQTVLFSQKGEVLAYDSLSGEAHASLRGTLLQDAGLVSGAASERVRAAFDGVAAKAAPVATPLAYGPEAKDKRYAGEAFDAATPAPAVSTTALWGQAYGGWSHGSSDGNAAAYNRSTGGIVTGVDALIAGTWRLGVLAGYGSTSLHGAGSSVSADSYQLGVYGGTTIDALRLSLGTILAHHEIDTRRTVSFGSLEETDTAGYSANTVQLFGEAAYRIETPYAALEPFAAAAYTHLKTSGFAETGGIAALSAPSSTTDLTTTTLGLRASRAFTLGNATTLRARGMAGWRHAYGDVTPQAQFAFASGGESFDISGRPIAADAALVEAGLAFDIGRATTLGLTYTGQFSAGVNDNSVKADLTVRF